MTITEAKKRFNGFTRWHNRMVKPEYRAKKSKLWDYYCSELMNTGGIEISGYQTLSGNPLNWY